jgi:orotate phosphoribosyltransferase-like protein
MFDEMASEVGVYRYVFHQSVAMGQVSNALFLSALAAEAIHGRVRVQLDSDFGTDPVTRSVIIDATTETGQTIARVFTEFISRELGEQSFTVTRISRSGLDLRTDPHGGVE